MLCFKSQAFLLLPTFLLFSSTFFSFCHGDSHLRHLQTIPISGLIGEKEYNGVVSWGTRRSVVEDSSAEPAINSSLILAAKRTHRKDPLNRLNRYSGGWNISNKHYWASVGFTAAPLFIIGAIWLLGFGLCLLGIGLYYCCCRQPHYGYSRIAYALSLIFLILFTIDAIIGCVVLYTGQQKFHTSTMDTLEYVVRQANITGDNLRNVSDYLAAAKQIKVDRAFLPSNALTRIDQIERKINSSASILASETKKNSNDIQAVLDSVRLTLIIVAAVMLLLTFLGFFFSILGMGFLVYILVFIGWILVAGTFVLCGIFLLLHNVVADTCVAMDQWVQHPTAHTALDKILPCMDNATAQETLLQSKDVSFQIVNLVNQVVSNIFNKNFPPRTPMPLYFNQSGPLLPLLCNPFNSDLTDRTCATGEVELANATKVWRKYVCQVSSAGICTTVGRLIPDFYNQMSAGVNVSYGLYRYGPFLVSLEDCTFARKTFSDIHRDHCPGLRRHSEWIYTGLVMVAVEVMLSLIFWVLYARERRHRVYTKQHVGTSDQGHFDEDKGSQ